MITVGMSRNESGAPVMLEKAYPTSEQIFGEWGPGWAEEARQAGQIVFVDGDDRGDRRYSHSSGDL